MTKRTIIFVIFFLSAVPVCHAETYDAGAIGLESLLKFLDDKLFHILTLIIGGVGFVVARFVFFTIDKTSNSGVIKRIKKNPAFAVSYAESLDLPFSNRGNISEEQFREIKQSLTNNMAVKDYRILHYCNLHDYRLLIFTEFSFIDYDVQVTGGSGDTHKRAFYNFIIEYDVQHQTLRTFSNLYSTAAEKLQKEGLIHALLPLPDPRPVYIYGDNDDPDQG